MFDFSNLCSTPVSKFHSAILMCGFLSGCVSYSDNDKNEYQIVLPTSQVQQVDDLALALKQAQTMPPDTTLIVFDIDDTLLTATEFFGSDKWYDWQRGRALGKNGQTLHTSKNDQVSCLFDTLGMAFEIAINQPTQQDMADLIHGVENDVLILTARSDHYRGATMRELARNDLDFSDKALTPPDVAYRYTFTLDGRSATVSYADGVFMVQGMDKGVMLLDLLKRVDRKYDAIVFIDDKSKNIDNMANALKSAGIDFYGFHYTRIDKSVTAKEVSQAQATAGALKRLLTEHFPDRSALIETGQCDY